MMTQTLDHLVRKLDSLAEAQSRVIPWSSPIPAFGNPPRSVVATLGLNPSNKEFVGDDGTELEGHTRRFQTLKSLGLSRWIDAEERHVEQIGESCLTYFERNPYDRWFGKLDRLIAETRVSYYGAKAGACHLDLIPFATSCKWTELNARQRNRLLAAAGNTLGCVLRDSPIKVLILNGRGVVEGFKAVSGARLVAQRMTPWDLGRAGRPSVPGLAYSGVVSEVAGVGLGRPLMVLGFNHNLQSSFGVSREVADRMRAWIGESARGLME